LYFVSSNAGGVLMHAHDGRVDHLDGRIVSGGKCVHNPSPYSGPSPPDETVVAGGAWAIAIRQIAPWCAGSQHQQMPLRTRRSSTRGTPRALFGNIGLMVAHS
jgi:hypothetical protein